MPCIASDFKRELRPPFRFPLPSETLVTGDAVPGGWVKKFSAGTRPAENDFNILLLPEVKELRKTGGFPLASFTRFRSPFEREFVRWEIRYAEPEGNFIYH